MHHTESEGLSAARARVVRCGHGWASRKRRFQQSIDAEKEEQQGKSRPVTAAYFARKPKGTRMQIEEQKHIVYSTETKVSDWNLVFHICLGCFSNIIGIVSFADSLERDQQSPIYCCVNIIKSSKFVSPAGLGMRNAAKFRYNVSYANSQVLFSLGGLEMSNTLLYLSSP